MNSSRLRAAAAMLSLLALSGCAGLSSWIPSIPVPSFDWFSSKKIGPLPPFTATATAKIIARPSSRRSPVGLPGYSVRA